MPTLTFKATEMKDAKVAHISLVDRAATRIPFKVIKQEKPMNAFNKHLDLASVFKKEKPVVVPQILGVITMKSDGFESIKGQISEAGFDVSKEAVLEDSSVVFGQAEDMEGDHVLVRLSEHAVMAVKGFNPYNMSVNFADGTSFAETCKAQGFYPGVGSMVDVLRSGVLSLAEKAEDPVAAAVKVGKMFDEAKQYAMTMVQGLPSKAFKLESIFPEGPDFETEDAAKAAEAAASAEAATAEAALKAAKPPGEGPGESETDEAKAARLAKTPAKKEDTTDAALNEEKVVSLVSDQMKEFTAKMETLLGGVTKSVENVGASVTALTSRVEAAEVVAKAASKAVEGTVVLGSNGGDQVDVVLKAESSGRGREIDTAFMPRQQRAVSGRR